MPQSKLQDVTQSVSSFCQLLQNRSAYILNKCTNLQTVTYTCESDVDVDVIINTTMMPTINGTSTSTPHHIHINIMTNVQYAVVSGANKQITFCFGRILHFNISS